MTIINIIKTFSEAHYLKQVEKLSKSFSFGSYKIQETRIFHFSILFMEIINRTKSSESYVTALFCTLHYTKVY